MKEKHNFWCYRSPVEMSQTAQSLFLFGAEIFRGAYIVENRNKLKDLLTVNPQQPHEQDFINNVLFNDLVDKIKILIFLENHMKARLIVTGHVAHIIDKNQLPELNKLQKKHPITVKEITEHCQIEINTEQNQIFISELSGNTLQLSTLIHKKDYVEVIELDDRILTFCETLRKDRNKLHFHTSITTSLSHEYISNISLIDEMIDEYLTIR